MMTRMIVTDGDYDDYFVKLDHIYIELKSKNTTLAKM